MDTDDATGKVANLDEEKQIEFLNEIEDCEQEGNLADFPEFEEAVKDHPVFRISQTTLNRVL